MRISTIVIILLLIFYNTLKSQEVNKDKAASTDQRIADLLSKMTLKEKIGQKI